MSSKHAKTLIIGSVVVAIIGFFLIDNYNSQMGFVYNIMNGKIYFTSHTIQDLVDCHLQRQTGRPETSCPTSFDYKWLFFVSILGVAYGSWKMWKK